MAIVSNEAQAVVINNSLYVPLNFKGTFAYVVAGGKIKTATFTSKQIVNYLGANYYTLPAGTQLAVGPGQDLYLVTKTAVIADLTLDGYASMSMNDLIDTEVNNSNGSYKYLEAGNTEFVFTSDDAEAFLDNEYAFALTGTYSYTENGSAVKSGYYNQSSSFNTKNLSGEGYNYKITESELPVSGSASGSASGKLPD